MLFSMSINIHNFTLCCNVMSQIGDFEDEITSMVVLWVWKKKGTKREEKRRIKGENGRKVDKTGRKGKKV